MQQQHRTQGPGDAQGDPDVIATPGRTTLTQRLARGAGVQFEAPVAVDPDAAARRHQINPAEAGVVVQRKETKKDPAQEQWTLDTARWVLDDVLDVGNARLLGDAPGTYRGPLEDLWKAMVGHDRAGKKLGGRERREIFDAAVLALEPVIAGIRDDQRAHLFRLRDTLFRAEADDRVDNSFIDDK